MMLNKKQLSEEDIKRLFITPALERAGWIRDRVRMEMILPVVEGHSVK